MRRFSSYVRAFLPIAASLFILLGVAQPAHAQLGSASPNVGTTAGGTVVDITSLTSLAGILSVEFGGVAATNIQLQGLFTVRATAPAHAAGVVNIVVRLPLGLTLTLANGYTYVGPPTVTSVVPNVGPTIGNTSVTIEGTNFRTGMSVTFGGQAATNVVLGSATSMTATTPAHSAGAVNVVVTNIENESATLTSGFTYQPVISTPTISQIAPTSGSAIGGTPVTITGTGFLSGATVTIGGASATSIIVQSTDTITAVTPPGVAGAQDVVVTNPDTGTATLTDGFTYVPISSPTLAAVTPSSGATVGGTAVQLTGTGFEPGATVTFDGLAATNVIVGTTETITATTPAHAAGAVNIVVTNPDTGSATLANGYTYVLVTGPTLGSASPSMGTTAGGTVVDITSLTAITGTLGTVEFDGIPATNVQLIDLFTIRATAPAHAAGVVDITVNMTILLLPLTVTLEDSYTYVPPPTVSSATPDSGPTVGGTAVTIAGNNFRTGMNVTFDGLPATGVTVNTSASLTATTPAHPVGPVDIVVTNIENESTTLVDGFTYEAVISTPSISGISPTSGTTDGGTPVTITGDGFAAGATVTIGGALATAVVVQSATSITAVTPAGTPGPRDVVVTNADTGTTTLTGGYTYVLITPPTLATITPDEGTTAGGTVVTITSVTALTGSLLGVEFDGVPATNVQLIDLFTIQATTPAHAPGVVDVSVRLQILLVPITVDIANGYTYVAPPTITSVVPNVGPTAGGTVVTVGGTNFRTGMTVTFDGLPATNISIDSDTTMTATTPAHALGPVDVVVTNVENESATLVAGFTYQPVISTPTISQIAPTSGSAIGGTPVTINGSGFISGATVTIGGASATSIIVQSAGTITAVTPPGIAGAQDVVVTNPDTGSVTLVDGFTYVAISSPTLTAVTPSSGATLGGTAVQLTGTGFEPGATVTFDGLAATNVIVATTETITATAPAHAPGAVNVVVTNPDSGSATLANGYTYVLVTGPTLGSASPSMGTTAGGTVVNITSLTALTGTLGTVEFDGIPATNVQLIDLFTIRVTAPAHAAGVVDITVNMTILLLPVTVTLEDSYTYVPPPTVSSATPDTGPTVGGTAVTIAGNNFRTGMSVTFDGLPATGVTVNTSASLTATTPAHAVGPVDIVVTNIEGESTTLVDGFTYEAVISTPSISGISPTSGTTDGGTPVTITGTGFAAGATVTIGGASATGVVIQSATSITAVTPAGTPGPRDVVVTNADTGTATLTGGYTYVLITPPTLGTITPDAGTTAGGTVVTITSVTALTGSLLGVEFDGVPATNVQLIDLFTIQATTPAHALGVVDVAVRLQILLVPLTVNLANGYTYVPPPTITSVVPSVGPPSGGTVVTIGGTNFRTGMTVTFDGLSATNISIDSDTTMTATTPAHALGPVDVVVTNLDSESATLVAGFTYQPGISSPTLTAISPASGATVGGTAVQLSGTGFEPGATVTFDSLAATNVIVAAANTITALTPAHVAGAVNVVVTNPDTGSATLANGYTYVLITPPTLGSASPSMGTTAGGTIVDITSLTALIGTLGTVEFDGIPGTNVQLLDPFTIRVTSPPHAAGVVDITVRLTILLLPVTLTLDDSYTYVPPPTVSSATPNVGPIAGGSTVTIGGNNFRTGMSVTFGGLPATGVTVNSSASLTATTPAHPAGPVDIVVMNIENESATLDDGFTYQAPISTPSISSIMPASGTTNGGTAVTISGTGFVGGATVTIGGAPATAVVIQSATTITAVTPAGTPGPRDVVVTNTDTGTTTLTGGYTYMAPPTITSVVPNEGPEAGGTLITITGTNFRSSMNVTLGGVPATGITVGSATSLTATTPAHAPGPVAVVISNVENESATLPAGFTYQPLISSPSISGIVPATGPATGGTPVTISGSDFAAGATVTIGGALATAVVVQSSTSITAVTPPGTAGARDVVVTNADTGTVTLIGGFTYTAISSPTLTNVSPNVGPETGGTSTTLTGTGFEAGATVLFGGMAATNVIVASATTITATTPPGAAGPVAVNVTNPDSGTVTLPDAFTYQAISSPTVTAVAPGSGLTMGGTPVAITGSDFQPGAVVTFDGVALTNVIVASPTTITGVTPAHVAGPVDVVVTNLDGGTATLPSGFAYVISQPTITSVTPPTGPTSGGTALTIIGTGFLPGATVMVCGSPATNVVVVSSTEITAVTPACAGGTADVTVTNPDGGSATLPGGFGAGVSDPIVGSVTPNFGPVTGGTSVTILGGNFAAGLTITFGGVPATNVNVLNTATISASTPPHAAGAVDVVVTNPDTSTDTLAGGFTYNPISTPTLTGITPNSGPAAGGTAVVITGTGFLTGAALTIEGVALTTLVVASPTTITGVTGACASPGLQDIAVLNPDGGTATLGNAFTCTVVSTPSINSVSPNSGPTAGGTFITISGQAFAAGATVLVGDIAATNVQVLSATQITGVTPPHASGPVSVRVLNLDSGSATLASGYTYLAPPSPNDNDNDGVPDDCEIQFGLDPSSGVGGDGPNGDPDGDGSTNAEECANGTHPRGFFTRYFAEGATGDFFDMRLSLVNPASSQAIVLVRYMTITGTQASDYLLVPGQAYKAVNPEANATTAAAEFSTVIESDVEIVAERSMFWDATHYGSHAETSLPAPGLTWYLAEGATHSGFDLFYLLQNPNPTAAEIDVSFLRPAGRPPLVKHYTVAAQTRLNIWVDLADPELAEEEISAVIHSTNNVPVLVERAMYLHAQGRHFGAGHGSQGVREPATTWSFAEGATGDFFDTFVLVANPNGTSARVRATYLLTNGQQLVKDYTVLANSRSTIWVDVEDAQLANTAVSVRLESLDGLPIIAERAMWWPGPTSATWYEAHNSAGAQLTGIEWVVAQGHVGGPDNAETYVLIANQSSFDGSAEVTVLIEDGTVERRTVFLPARSRTNVDVGADFPTVDGSRFGVIVTSQGSTPAQVIVESSVYLSRGGEVWAGGGNALATRLR